LDFFQVWLCLMLKHWQVLERHFVRLPGAPTRSVEEAILFLQGRVASIVTPSTSPLPLQS
jgi:hypothetical protein